MSNLIKSGFIAFSQNDKLVIDANQSEIIKGIDLANQEMISAEASSMEEALAEAMIHDVGLDESDENLLTMDTAEIPVLSEDSPEQLQMMAEEVLSSAKQEAEQIVSKAHDEAEQLRGSAYEEAENIKENAKKEGYQDGYEEAQAVLQDEFDAKLKELEQKEQEFDQYMVTKEEELVKTTEKKMVEFLCKMIPSITGVEVEGEKNVLFYMINAAMRDLENSTHFVIKVSSEDYKNLFERKEEIYGALNPNIEIELFEDAKLSELQCVIETDNGIVDLSLDVQLNNLKKALKLMILE